MELCKEVLKRLTPSINVNKEMEEKLLTPLREVLS